MTNFHHSIPLSSSYQIVPILLEQMNIFAKGHESFQHIDYLDQGTYERPWLVVVMLHHRLAEHLVPVRIPTSLCRPSP